MTRGSLGALALATLLGGCSAAAPVDEDGTTRQAGREQQPTRCVGTLGAETVQGDLEVPRGRTCRLLGTAVDGRVQVGLGSTLHARSAVFGEGIGAHGFRRVVIEGGKVAGRGPNFVFEASGSHANDYVFDGGGSLRIEDGDSRGHYYVVDNHGPIVLRGLYLDTGGIYCAGNDREPDVRNISAESPGVLDGQCAGLRNFGDSDF